jgi:hypothetical protein
LHELIDSYAYQEFHSFLHGYFEKEIVQQSDDTAKPITVYRLRDYAVETLAKGINS